jgi:hypothetical protein
MHCRALLALQVSKVQQYPFTDRQQVSAPEEAGGQPQDCLCQPNPIPSSGYQGQAFHNADVCHGQNCWMLYLQVMAADWEAYVGEIASDILREQSPKSLYTVGGGWWVGESWW